MRTDRTSGWRIVAAWVCALACVSAAGCQSSNSANSAALQGGYDALAQQRYDEAIGAADASIKSQPAGTGSAAALYLKGRAIAQRPKANTAAGAADLNEARGLYVKALASQPDAKLEGLIHCDLANVAYFQEDYATAELEWTRGYEKLAPDSPARLNVLYRIGVSRQRQGKWKPADEVFAAIQRDASNSKLTQAAKEHQGFNAFFVQVGAFKDPRSAQAAAQALAARGMSAQVRETPDGLQAVLAGPKQTYREAAGLRGQLSSSYSDARIVP